MPNSDDSKHELDADIADLLGIPADTSLSTADTSLSTNEQKSQTIELGETSDYFKNVLEDENIAMVENLQDARANFEGTTDKDEKSMYREKLAAAYWNFYRSMVPKVLKNISLEKRLALRFNLLDSSIISESQLKMIKSIPLETENENIFYTDEWFSQIGDGNIDQSVIDETITAKKRQGASNQEKLDRKKGQKEAEVLLIKNKGLQVKDIEETINRLVTEIQHREQPFEVEEKKENLIEPYSEDQKVALSELMEKCKSISKLDREIKSAYRTLAHVDEDIIKLSEGSDDDIDVDESNKVDSELNSVKQMIKMSVGKQGNHFPILTENYFTDEINQVATKENVEKVINEIEKLDHSLFIRTYKGEDHRIAPYLILVPCYGEFGICWDPIPKNNRATGKGRLAIPIFPKNLRLALLFALADLRWQVAKEKAQHYWMEEGLTGEYYEYFTAEKLKGDIKRHFINDYMLWINWESQGVQKLNRDVRSSFWRRLPFPQDVKDVLKTKGFFYSELHEKDKRREKSAGH